MAALALAEDGIRDLTTEVVQAPGLRVTGTVRFRSGGVVAGRAYAEAVAHQAGCTEVVAEADDGSRVAPGAPLLRLRGDSSALLRAERPMLNLLQRACGIATATAAYVEAVAGTPCRILHTRKTVPGLRAFDVRGVIAGGGDRHRSGLERVVMVKDNHWWVLQRRGVSLRSALDRARAEGCREAYVEVETPTEVETACAAGANRLLIDNQPLESFRDLATLARRLVPGITLEATGGIGLENVRGYALAGADFASVGALTHSVRAVDVALELGD